MHYSRSLSAVCLLWFGLASSQGAQPKVSRDLAALPASQVVDVIVQYKVPPNAAKQARAQRYGGEFKKALRLVSGTVYRLQAGSLAIRNRAITPKDVVIGIAASGRTPFVWGAIREAKKRGAFTALICFNPAMRTAVKRVRDARWKPAVMITPNAGPEVLTGSTRLKSGTATKLILNMITTLAMTKVGKVISNLMVDVNPSNVKLRDRAVRIISELTGTTHEEARAALNDSGWAVKAAYLAIKRRK